MKATFVKDVSEDFWGHAELFRLDESKFLLGSGRKYNHVVVSAIHDEWAHETYIFPANKNGEIINFLELNGSYRGGTQIDQALRNAGYEVVR